MNATDVIVLPFQENLSSASVMVAMSFGKAIIIRRTERVPEILDDQICIFCDETK